MVGVADGRAGNLRGMDHLASIIHHLGGFVHPKSQPISKVSELVSQGQITDAATMDILDKMMKEFLEY